MALTTGLGRWQAPHTVSHARYGESPGGGCWLADGSRERSAIGSWLAGDVTRRHTPSVAAHRRPVRFLKGCCPVRQKPKNHYAAGNVSPDLNSNSGGGDGGGGGSAAAATDAASGAVYDSACNGGLLGELLSRWLHVAFAAATAAEAPAAAAAAATVPTGAATPPPPPPSSLVQTATNETAWQLILPARMVKRWEG